MGHEGIPAVPQHPSCTCSASCINRFQSSEIKFDRFCHRAFILGTEIMVKWTQSWLRLRACINISVREVQGHLSSVIISNFVADQLQAPAAEDVTLLSPEHCPRISSGAFSLKKLMLHKC